MLTQIKIERYKSLYDVTMFRKLIIITLLAIGWLSGCQAQPVVTPEPQPITLRFTYWGSPVEKNAVEAMVKQFEAANPTIKIEALHIPNDQYIAQLSAMLASNTPPDIGYLPETHAALWASEGKVLDLTDLVKQDNELASRLPETYYSFAPNRTLGTNTAAEIVIMFYNKDLFDQAGLAYPPAKAEEAWTWEQFVSAAKKLTKDVNGKHPDEAGFDPNQIDVYGVSFDKGFFWGYYPFIYSNGGEVVNEDGSQLKLNEPAAIEAIKKMRALMWEDHVTATPAQEKNLPSRTVLMQTGKLAMDMGGQWNLLDYSSMQDLHLGVAVLPKLKEPKTLMLGSPTVIFKNTAHQEAAVKFYKFHNNPQAVDLFARGLWMPLQKEYYTDPAKIAAWTDNAAHPKESKEALVNYALCCVVATPHYYVKNFGQISAEAIQPAIDLIWNNQATVEEALQQATDKAAPLLSGRWDK